MADDRRKTLEALVAKRKAESESGVRHSKPNLGSSLHSKPAAKKSSSPFDKAKFKPKPSSLSPLLKKKTKTESPVKKKKRVEKYESEDDEDGVDSQGEEDDSDSEVETVKKKPASKGGSSVKTAAVKPSKPFGMKGKEGAKGKAMAKEKAPVKGKRKSEDSSDEGASDEDEEEAGEADSGDEGLDLSNVLPGRTRRRSSQPAHYDLADGSDDDDDDSD